MKKRNVAPTFDYRELRKSERSDVIEARRRREPGRSRQGEVGLAISGGGIRSSTFALGVLQGLAKSGVLAEVDYISAVSGGGYISSWLAKLIRQHGFRGASALLLSNSDELRWLRRSVSYLRSPASRHATGSALFAATYVHNLGSSLLSLVAVITGLLLTPRIILSIVKGILDNAVLAHSAAAFGLTLTFTVIIVVVISLARHERDLFKSFLLDVAVLVPTLWFCWLIYSNKHLQLNAVRYFFAAAPCAFALRLYWNKRNTTPNLRGRAQLNVLALTGLVFSSTWLFALSAAFAEPHHYRLFDIIRRVYRQSHSSLKWRLLLVAHSYGFQHPQTMSLLTSIILSVSGLLAILCARLLMKQGALEWLVKWFNRRFLEVLKYLLSCSLLFLLATYVEVRLPALVWGIHVMRQSTGFQAIFLFFGILVPAAIMLIGFAAGISMVLLGRTLSPYMRENVTDLIALIYQSAALCAGLSIIAIYGPLLLYRTPLHQDIYFWFVWSASIIAGAWLKPGERLYESAIRRYAARVIVTAVPYVFLLGVLILISFGISRWVFHIEQWHTLQAYFEQCDATLGGPTIWLFAVVLFGAALFSARSGVNSSSMHRYYLARLSETFLGEAPTGAPAKFQAFASSGLASDHLRFHQLRPSDGYHGPVLLLNCCLNAKDRSDARARLGENFVFSSRGCGFFPSDDHMNVGVFQDPSQYFYAGDKGVSLASCMAISGSALGSGMGYLSSLRTRLFHTMFNFRLGWWFCNPRYPGAWNGNIPRSRISCLMKELLGNMTDHDPFIYLSDGGHFDNLGAYELLRRRCGVIIVSDASRDSRQTFTALAHSISKARIDLNVSIEFDEHQPIYQKRGSADRIAVGTIRYPDAKDGIIIYIKPKVFGIEPMDVVGHARAHPAFPHDPTSSQWFSEAQFEAYRKLGELSGEAAADKYRSHCGQTGTKSV